MASLTGAVVVRKRADETVNNSSTLQNDDDLVIAIEANETWRFEAMILFNSAATPDIKVGFALPPGATVSWIDLSRVTSDTPEMNEPVTTSGAVARNSGTGADSVLVLYGIVVNGGSAGDVRVQWAQSSTNASDTKVLATSYLMGVREA